MLNDKKIPYLRLVPILLIAFILYKLVDNFGILLVGLRFFLSVFSYLIWAFAIAYLFNPLMVILESRLKLKRTFSLLIVYLVLISAVTLVIIIITPSLVRSITELAENLPNYFSRLEKWTTQIINDLKLVDKYSLIPYLNDNLGNVLKDASKYMNISLNVMLTKTLNLTSGMIKLIFGLILSIYLLKDKERIAATFKNILYAFLSKDNAEGVVFFSREVNSIFSRYIIGRTVDSMIIGTICFTGLLIMRAPFALLISFIVGITNMIPYIGPLIGTVPSVLIVLLVNPVKSLWVLIFLVLLQQFDGWYLGPRILGNSVGLTPLLVIVAIIVGGGIFGIPGMFLSVPFMAVFKLLLNRYIGKRLKAKGIDSF